MSVMCAVFVPDGIVMAADSRQTVGIANVQVKPGTHPGVKQGEPSLINRMDMPGQPQMTPIFTQSDNAQKVMLLSKVKVGISACGIGILDGKTVSDYIRSFEIEEVTEHDSVTAVANKLQKYASKFFPQVNFFVCGYDEDEPFTYTVNRDIKRNNLENGKMRYSSIWSGEQAAITKLLNGQPPMMINHALMPLKDAIDFAEFLIDLTIKSQRFEFKPATCGGPIDILVMTKDQPFWYRHKVYKPE
ncbi:MAG: hypothetical protein ACI4NQ_00360 [Christensenellales bacterium]